MGWGRLTSAPRKTDARVLCQDPASRSTRANQGQTKCTALSKPYPGLLQTILNQEHPVEAASPGHATT